MIIACAICKKQKIAYSSSIKTCGGAECKKRYKGIANRNRDPRWKANLSNVAKQKGFGLWMKGRNGSERQKEVARANWLGANNPRWKGGVPRSVTHKNWLAAHPENVHHYHRLRKAWRRGAPGSYTLGEWLALKRAYLFTCPNPTCLKTESEIKLTADHIIPVSRGGSNKIENIQPLCESCNAKKWARTQNFDTAPIVEKFKNAIPA